MKYKRITKVKSTSKNTKPCYDKNGNIVMDKEAFDSFIEEHNQLFELENKIENGTLIELPCKVGDTVYIATKFWDIKEVVEAKVVCIEATAEEKSVHYRTFLDHKFVFSKTNPNLIVNRHIFFNDEFFLTKAEAEQKLKDLKEV